MRCLNPLLHQLLNACAAYGAALCGLPVAEVHDER